MKALLCHEFGPPERLRFGEIAEPQPGPRQVLVKVKTASLNFPDVIIIEGKYQHRPPFPFSPGSEAAGIVMATGCEVTRVRVGDHVAAFTLWGAFAEACLADESAVISLAEHVDFASAAASLLVGGTALYGLQDRGRLQAGETLLVLGASGGTGIAAVQIGKELGARVIAAASSAPKLDLCRQVGADAVIDYVHENLRERLKQLTDGRGPDVVFDPVGGDHTEATLRSLAWNGRLLIVGFAAGSIPRVPVNLTLLMNRKVVGVNWGMFGQHEPAAHQRHMMQLADWLASGRLRPPITESVAFADLQQAMSRMAARQTMGKVVVRIAD